MTPRTVKDYCQMASVARREGRPDDAKSSAEQAVILARASGNDAELVRALMMLGQVERDNDRHPEALKSYQEAVRLSRIVDPPTRFAHTLRHLGDLHTERGQLTEAETHYAEALDIYRTSDDTTPGDLANMLRAYAVMKDAAGSAVDARRLWTEARRLYQSLGIQEGVDECDTRINR
ncbi:MAG: tetratricopeptide repeat protein [Planctomycetota bacterium]